MLTSPNGSVGALAVACLVSGAWPTSGWRHGWGGLLEPGVAYQLALAGLALTSAANASVLGSLEPVMVPLIAWLLLRDRPRPRLIVFVAGATIGSALVSFSGGNGNGSLAGDALIVASVAAAALYVVVASRQVTVVRPLPAAFTVASMPSGLETKVGARGVRLSGGQVQRAAIARAVVRHTDMLVLDDVSSALDVETERLLWDRLPADPDRTLLVVSNRPATIALADHVIHLDHGHIQAGSERPTVPAYAA